MHQQSAQTGDDSIRRPKVGRSLSTTIQNQGLVSHQDGFGNNGAESTGSTKPDDDDDGMQKESENVAHAQDSTKRKKLKNSKPLAEFATNRLNQLLIEWLG
jgi:hypothetical protein